MYTELLLKTMFIKVSDFTLINKRIKAYCIIVFAISLMSCLMNKTLAQNSPNKNSNNLHELTLEELLNVKVSIASRRFEKTSDAPSSVTVFTHKDFEEMGITHLDELYNFIPGMLSVRRVFDTRFETTAVRGIGHTWGDGVQLMINGLRQQDSYSGGGALFNRRLSLDNVERVEVIRGPGSSLYGANAFLGVINIITSNKLNNVSASLGSFDAYRASLNLSRQGDDWQFSLFADTFSDDGDDYNNLFDRFGRTNSSTDPIEGKDLALSFQYSDITIKARYMERESFNFHNWGLLSNSVARNKTDYLQLFVEYELPLSEQWKATVSVSSTSSNWRGTGIFETQGTGPFVAADFIAGPVMEHKDKTFSTNFAYDFSENHQINFGLQYENMSIPKAGHNSNYDFLSGFSTYLGHVVDQFDESIRFVIDSKRLVAGGYIQDQYHWNDKISTTLGLRYDHFNDFQSTFNPRAALNYQFNERHKFKIMYGEAFRAPSMNNLGTQNNPAIIGNSDLMPENIKSFEIAHLYKTDKFETTATLYHNHINNIISQITNPEGLVQYENSGENESDGLEFEIVYVITENVHFRANYSHIFNNKTKLAAASGMDKGEHFLPNQTASISLIYNYGDYLINLSGFMRGKIDELPNENSITVINSNIRYQLTKNSSFFFTIKNVFDKSYYDAATGSGVGIDSNGEPIRAIPNRGRQIAIGYRYNF